VKIGVVGLGAWSQKLIKCMPNPQHLFGVLTNRADAERLLPGGTRIYRSYEEFADAGLNRIIIANEATKHLLALKKIRSTLPKIPILIEKPFATSIANANDYVDNFGLDDNLIVNHTLLFNKNIYALKQRHLFSIPNTINCADCNLGPYRSDCNSLWDYGPHPISVALYFSNLDQYPIEVDVLEATQTNSSFGSITNFRLVINNKTEVLGSVGNGFPLKIRKYLFSFNGNEIVEFDGLKKEEPQPLQQILSEFCEFSDGDSKIRDCRWGLKIPIGVVKIIAEIEKKLNLQKNPLLD
jgi:hypothetical protein